MLPASAKFLLASFVSALSPTDMSGSRESGWEHHVVVPPGETAFIAKEIDSDIRLTVSFGDQVLVADSPRGGVSEEIIILNSMSESPVTFQVERLDSCL